MATSREPRREQRLEELRSTGGHYEALLRDAERVGMSTKDFEDLILTVDWSDNSPEGSKARFLEAIGRRSRPRPGAIADAGFDPHTDPEAQGGIQD